MNFKTVEEVKALGYEMVSFDSKVGDKVILTVNGNNKVCEYGIVNYTRETFTKPMGGKKIRIVNAELTEKYHPRHSEGHVKIDFETKKVIF